MAFKRVMLITADQWRGDSLSCTGHSVIKTPSADSLACDGVLFKRHYTCSVPCGPSRASLLTGMYPTNHRMVTNGTPLNSDFTNIALEMRKDGFSPILFGYTDITPDPRKHADTDPALRSFEGVLPGFSVGQPLLEDNKPWLASLKRLGYEVNGIGRDIYTPEKLTPATGLSSEPAAYKSEHSETAWMTDRIIDHMEFCGDDPFFIHASFIRPHPPFIAPAPYNDMYRDKETPKPVKASSYEEEVTQHPAVGFYHDNKSLNRFLMGVGDRPLKELSDEDIHHIRATYYGLITEVDTQIGRLIQFLKDRDLYDETLIILTSDHGEQMGDHYLLGKQTHFEKSFHIPLIVKPAEYSEGGKIITDFTESIDIMPTILDACHLEVPHQCDGLSLMPFLRGEKPENWRQEVCALFDFREVKTREAEERFGLQSDQCALMFLRDEKYKYIHFNGLPPVFYDLIKDPGELVNVAQREEYMPLVLEYAQKLLSWRMRHEYGALDRMTATDRGMYVA